MRVIVVMAGEKLLECESSIMNPWNFLFYLKFSIEKNNELNIDQKLFNCSQYYYYMYIQNVIKFQCEQCSLNIYIST